MLLLLGGVLLLFICKCMKALYRERSDRIDDVTTTKEDNIDHQIVSVPYLPISTSTEVNCPRGVDLCDDMDLL